MDKFCLPSDYEACGECGYDHSYEPVESAMAHIHFRAQLFAYANCGKVKSFPDHDQIFYLVGRNATDEFWLSASPDTGDITKLAVCQDTGENKYSHVPDLSKDYYGHF